MSDLKKLQALLDEFSKERDWDQFHSPKNLSMSLAVEAAELMEIFLWETTDESYHVKDHSEQHIKEELADVFLNLLRLSSILKIDLVEASLEKLKINAEKYPVASSKGKHKKQIHTLS